MVQSLDNIPCLWLQGVKEDVVIGGKGEIVIVVEVLVRWGVLPNLLVPPAGRLSVDTRESAIGCFGGRLRGLADLGPRGVTVALLWGLCDVAVGPLRGAR